MVQSFASLKILKSPRVQLKQCHDYVASKVGHTMALLIAVLSFLVITYTVCEELLLWQGEGFHEVVIKLVSRLVRSVLIMVGICYLPITVFCSAKSRSVYKIDGAQPYPFGQLIFVVSFPITLVLFIKPFALELEWCVALLSFLSLSVLYACRTKVSGTNFLLIKVFLAQTCAVLIAVLLFHVDGSWEQKVGPMICVFFLLLNYGVLTFSVAYLLQTSLITICSSVATELEKLYNDEENIVTENVKGYMENLKKLLGEGSPRSELPDPSKNYNNVKDFDIHHRDARDFFEKQLSIFYNSFYKETNVAPPLKTDDAAPSPLAEPKSEDSKKAEKPG